MPVLVVQVSGQFLPHALEANEPDPLVHHERFAGQDAKHVGCHHLVGVAGPAAGAADFVERDEKHRASAVTHNRVGPGAVAGEGRHFAEQVAGTEHADDQPAAGFVLLLDQDSPVQDQADRRLRLTGQAKQVAFGKNAFDGVKATKQNAELLSRQAGKQPGAYQDRFPAIGQAIPPALP